MKKKVPNPDLEKLNLARNEEIAKREAEYAKLCEEYEIKKKEFDELAAATTPVKPEEAPEIKKDETKKDEVKKEETKKEPKKEAPEKPLKPINPPEVPIEVEVTEKVPRIANMSMDINFDHVYGYYNVSARALELHQFELKC